MIVTALKNTYNADTPLNQVYAHDLPITKQDLQEYQQKKIILMKLQKLQMLNMVYGVVIIK